MVKKAAKTVGKKGRASKPRVALCGVTLWIEQQLSEASRQEQSGVARKIVDSLSIAELRGVPSEMRRRLSELLSAGRISNAHRRAVDKLLSAELMEVEYQSRLVIKGPSDFVEKTRTHLAILAQMPIGRRLLRSLLQSGKQVAIIPAPRMCEAPPDDFKAAMPKGAVLKWRDQSGKERIIRGLGKGSNTTVKYNPDMKFYLAGGNRNQCPPEIGLAHELIHADDAAYGRLDPGITEGVRNYECQAVGLPPYEHKEFTENKFRAQWYAPLPPRTSY